MKKLIILSVATLATSAMSYQCEVDLIDLRTNALIDTFYAQDDGSGSCREGLKECGLELRKRGYDRQTAMCSTQPIGPSQGSGPGQGPRNDQESYPAQWDQIIDKIENEIRSPSAAVRYEALKKLANYPTVRSLDIMIGRLNDSNQGNINFAYYGSQRMIQKIDWSREFFHLRSLVLKNRYSSSNDIFQMTLTAVDATAVYSADLLDLILELSSSPQDAVRFRADDTILKLLQAPDISYIARRDIGLLENLINSEKGLKAKLNALKVLSLSEDPLALKVLLTSLSNPELEVRNKSSVISGQMVQNVFVMQKLSRNIYSIAPLTTHWNATVRVFTLRYLGMTRNKQIRPYVRAALEDSNLNVRAEADRIYKEMNRW